MQTAAKAIKPVKGSVPIQHQLLAEKIVAESWSAGEFVIQESLAQVRYPIYLYFVLLYHTLLCSPLRVESLGRMEQL